MAIEDKLIPDAIVEKKEPFFSKSKPCTWFTSLPFAKRQWFPLPNKYYLLPCYFILNQYKLHVLNAVATVSKH